MKVHSVVRKAVSGDVAAIVALVTDVISETYGDLFEELPPVPADTNLWIQSWVADCEGKIVGVGLADGDYVDDLWVLAEYRGNKVGASLLSKLEDQIRSNGHTHARLRVVADNEGARRFYIRHGWQGTRIYPHERFGHSMVDLQKKLGPLEMGATLP